MKHQLILFYGSSTGAGKSTLSSQLNQQFALHHLPAQWIYEDDVLHLEHFRPVVKCVERGGGPDLLDASLEATERLVDAYSGTDTTVVTDSILPYYDWLLAATIDEAAIAEFSHKLWLLLLPMNPIIVYLQADVETALKRAVAYRGDAWLEGSITFMNTWGATQSQPLHNLADVITYSQRTDQIKRRLLSGWPGEVLWLDSVSMSLDATVTKLMSYLELEPMSKEDALQFQNIDRYVGQYKASDHDLPSGQQTITVFIKDGELWADIYWPNGCRLVAESTQVFQLRDTSHRIELVESDGHITQLQYSYRGAQYIYTRERQ